jgi:hypothetical protein
MIEACPSLPVDLTGSQLNARLRPYQLAIKWIVKLIRKSLNGTLDSDDEKLEELLSRDSMLIEWRERIEAVMKVNGESGIGGVLDELESELYRHANVDSTKKWNGPNSGAVFSAGGFLFFDQTYETVVQQYHQTLERHDLSPEQFSHCLDVLIHPMDFYSQYFRSSRRSEHHSALEIEGIKIYRWGEGSAGTQYCPFGDEYFGSDWEAKIVCGEMTSRVTQLHPHLIRDHHFPEGNCYAGSAFNLEGLCKMISDKRMVEWETCSTSASSLSYAMETPIWPEYRWGGTDFYQLDGNLNEDAWDELRNGFTEWEKDGDIFCSWNNQREGVLLVARSSDIPSFSDFDHIQKKERRDEEPRSEIVGRRTCSPFHLDFFHEKSQEYRTPVPAILQVENREYAHPASINLLDPETYIQ